MKTPEKLREELRDMILNVCGAYRGEQLAEAFEQARKREECFPPKPFYPGATTYQNPINDEVLDK